MTAQGPPLPRARHNGPVNTARAGYENVPPASAGPAGRSWWDANAAEYLAEHGDFLGASDFCWCPEGLREDDARLLGDVSGTRILEIGSGAAQCSRWLTEHGANVIATDISGAMLGAGAAPRPSSNPGNAAPGRATSSAKASPAFIQADARALPFQDASFDVVFTSYGAIPFVPDADRVHLEVARVLRPGGRWVFSVTHPIRWAFPDDPSEHGLRATHSYFDRTPYAEVGAGGRTEYVEYHRTIGDHVRELAAAGFILANIVEPEWPDGHDRVWGGWSPTRGRIIPGTAIFVANLPA